LALRQHRLPRFWLGLTLGLVATGLGAAYWWERQLPGRLEQAAEQGDLDACLRYSEQLQALRWLGDRSPAEQGECRRRKAAQLWQQQRWRDALLQQLQLVNSAAGQPTDRRQLEAWQESLRVQAMERFQAGQLEESLELLAPMGEDHRSDGSGLGDQLRQAWGRNRLSFERAQRLRQDQRWWEALEALNRIDHPCGKRKGSPCEPRCRPASPDCAVMSASTTATARCPIQSPWRIWIGRYSAASSRAWTSGAPSRAAVQPSADGWWKPARIRLASASRGLQPRLPRDKIGRAKRAGSCNTVNLEPALSRLSISCSRAIR
jgi:hypothetical protein